MIFLGECTSVYGYTLYKIYGESWHYLSGSYDSPSYYITWILNLKRILSLCWSQHKVLTYGLDPKVIIYILQIGSLSMKTSENRYSW